MDHFVVAVVDMKVVVPLVVLDSAQKRKGKKTKIMWDKLTLCAFTDKSIGIAFGL